MKNMRILFAGLFLMSSILPAMSQDAVYGEKFTYTKSVPAAQLKTKMGEKTEMVAIVEGTVVSVCQAKGCWMTVDIGNGETMRITFLDYGFFVPKDLSGKKVVLNGTAKVTTTSVAELRHYAEDAGKSDEEINKIDAPKTEVTFEASGVIVRS